MRLQGLHGLSALTLAQAITRQENTPASWNNPGALTAAPSIYCQTGKINGIVQFCTPEDGQAALDNQLDIYANEGLTLQQTINLYAPAPPPGNTNPLLVGNDPGVYTQNVSSWTGISPGTPLSSVGSGMLYAGGTVDTGTAALIDESMGDYGNEYGSGDVGGTIDSILAGNLDLTDPTTVVVLSAAALALLFLASSFRK